MRGLPATRSGRARIVGLSDDDAWALAPGDGLLVMDIHGLASITVDRVRPGIAYDDSQPPQAFEVPVIESGPRVIAVPDLFTVALDEESHASAAQHGEARVA